MPSNASDLSRALLVADGGADAASSPERVAAAAEQIWKRLAQHFARLIGSAGIEAVLERSIALAGVRAPWLVARDTTWSLAGALRGQTLAAGIDGFGDLVTTFVALLGRFIGDALVRRVLAELWPTVFSIVSKELP